MKLIKNNSYLLFVIILCFVFAAVGVNKLSQEVAYDKVIISEGDTLWNYSLQYGDNIPKDKWIKEVISLNNLTSTKIEVGKELKIPIRKGYGQNDTATNLAGDND